MAGPLRPRGWQGILGQVESMSIAKRNFNQAAPTWDQEPRRVKLASDVAQAITHAAQPNREMDALDFGCGTGLLTLQLEPLVRSITGIDSSQGMLDVLNAKIRSQHLTNVRTRCLDLDKGDQLEGTYHLVVSSMTLHHIREVAPLLRQLSRILLPGGQLCIADLDPDGGQFHDNSEGVFHNGFPEAELRRAFAEAGLDDIRYRTAAKLPKPVPGGGDRVFTVFLMTGRK
jgi:ubiquinone/menaquinone biosynthesis C-methylase UbiE